MMKYLKTILWLGTIIFVGRYFYSVIIENWQQIINLQLRGSTSDLLLLILFALMVYLTNSLSWHLITKSLGMKLSYLDNLEVWVLSNASRFIPGVIWQYAGRVYLASEKGVSKTLATACLQIEGLLTIFVGTLIILLAVNFNYLPINLPISLVSTLALMVAVIFLLVFTNKGSLKLLSKLLEKITKKPIYLEQAILPLQWIPVILFSFLLQFLIDGAVLFFLTRNLIEIPFELYPVFVAIFAASWLAGYLSFFAPSGLGIQELTMTALLSLFLPASFALIIALLFRVVLLTSEILTITITKVVVARS